HHLVLTVRHGSELAVRETEPPVSTVVARAIGDPVGVVRERVEVRPQLGQAQATPHRHAVTHDVESVGSEIDDPLPAGVRNVRVTDVPLVRHGPVQNSRSAGDFADLERQYALQNAKRLADTVSRNAPTDRKELGREIVYLMAA